MHGILEIHEKLNQKAAVLPLHAAILKQCCYEDPHKRDEPITAVPLRAVGAKCCVKRRGR